MTNETKKVIDWALKDVDAYGSHISNLSNAINSGRLSQETVEQLKEVQSQWHSSAQPNRYATA